MQIPHFGLLDRPFALWPLVDVAPDWIYPGANPQPVQELIKAWGSRFDGLAPFHTRQIENRVDTPKIIGVLNVTPDSFSDGGQYNVVEKAIEQVEYLFQSGAEVIDIGAESTRPNATSVSPDLEWERLQPVLDALCTIRKSKPSRPEISIDTRHAEVAKKALDFEIDWINDVTGFNSTEMRDAVRDSHVKLVFMHSMSIPADPNIIVPPHNNICHYVKQWGQSRIESLMKEGIDRDRLIFDVGIGFGKSAEQSLILLKRIDEFKDLDVPMLTGHSRKSFLRQFTAVPPAERDLETAIISNFLANHSVDYLRVHNVETTMRAFKIKAVF